MASLICTLFEGHYHLGAAALLNSLHRHGFKGTFVCGYRGAKPAWADCCAERLPEIRVHWLALTTPVHLTNYKPTFLKTCLQMMPRGEEGSLYYLDPDIVVKAPWRIFERWARTGIAVVEDINASMPAGHPYRLQWHDLYASRGKSPRRRMERYYNGGFVGLAPQEAAFLDLWESIIVWSAEASGGLGKLKNAQPHDLFHSADQDAMNMALELSSMEVFSAGPEAMDFTPGGHLLSHAAGGVKPWRGGFLREALKGRPPSLAQKCYYEYVEGPIPVMTRTSKVIRRIEIQAAAMLGRFYQRT